MHTRIFSDQLVEHMGERVVLQGWLHNIRRLGGVSFIFLRDGWGIAQAVAEKEADLAEIAGIPLESIIQLEGIVTANAQAPMGVELWHPKIRLLNTAVEPPPVPLHKRTINAALPHLLDHAVVANRHPQRQAIFRLASEAMAAFRHVLAQRRFTEIQSPKLVASATESGSNIFELPYFGRSAYLAQSPQFYKQIMVGVFERVYEVAPVFRAEQHDTSRHLNEYVSLDVEFGFIEDHFSVMRLAETTIREICSSIAGNCLPELNLLEAQMPAIPESIPHIHFSDAQALLQQTQPATGVYPDGDSDLTPQEERWLGAWAQTEFGSDFLFVTGYPMAKRPFYTHPDPARSDFSNSFDLLFRGVELITGGQRLHRYQDYLAALERENLPADAFAHYLSAFKHGMPAHGGFAIGLERLLTQLLGLSNIRLATLFPRDQKRLSP